MRVLLVTSIPRGGPVEQALVLSRALAERGVSVDAVCATPELAERFAAAGARALLIPLRHQADARSAAAIARIAHGADVVHAHDRRAGLWTRLGPRPRPRGLRVYTAHGIPEPFHPPPVGDGRPGLRARLLYRGLDGGLARRADAIVVPSRAVARDLAAQLGYPADRLVVIPNGVELRPPPVRRGELVGTFSVLEPFKAVDVFVRAAARLAAERPDLPFAVFGSGSQAEPLDRLIGTLGLGSRIRRPGFVPAAAAFRQLGVYVLCSWWENAPMALLEAMAAEVPVVASAVYGIPEIVDESTARMVAPGDPDALALAIGRALDDEAGTRERVAAASRRVRERFSAGANAGATLSLYERLLA